MAGAEKTNSSISKAKIVKIPVKQGQRLDFYEVEGDNMAPTFKRGDVIVIDRNCLCFRGDGLYLLGWDEYEIIRRIAQAGGGQYHSICDNPLYTPDIIKGRDKLNSLITGRVCGSMRHLAEPMQYRITGTC